MLILQVGQGVLHIYVSGQLNTSSLGASKSLQQDNIFKASQYSHITNILV